MEFLQLVKKFNPKIQYFNPVLGDGEESTMWFLHEQAGEVLARVLHQWGSVASVSAIVLQASAAC